MNPEIIVIIVLVFLIIASFFFATNDAITENSRYFRQILSFLLVSTIFTAILLGCVFYIGKRIDKFDVTIICLILSAVAILLGFLYVMSFDGNLNWVDKLALSNKIWFTLALALIGQLLILVIAKYLYESESRELLWVGGLFFPVPFFMREAFKAWNAIPEPIFKVWTIPNSRPDIRKFPIDLVAGYPTITIVQNKNIFAEEKPKLPLKAPFGEIFHAFLIQLNNDRIQLGKQSLNLGNDSGAGTKWQFYIIEKNFLKKLLRGNIYIDPQKSCEELNISEKNIIAEIL